VGFGCGTTYAFVRSHEQSRASGFCNLHDGSIPRSDDRAGAPRSFHGEAVGVLIKSVVKTAPRLDHKESAERVEIVLETLLLSRSRLDKVEDAATVLLLNLSLERLKSVDRR
jgi:hypothetical protein